MNYRKLISLPRSFVINVRLFGIGGGYKIPLLIDNHIKVEGIRRGAVNIDYAKACSVEIGFSGVRGMRREKGALILGENGSIEFKGSACMSVGTIIRVDSGSLIFGNKFSCNNSCFISCTEGITFGDNVLIGWNVNIRDSDGHTMIRDGEKMESLKKVTIGDHVWIASYVDILKGAAIPDGCVVAYRSCVTKSIDKKNCLVGGYPAKIIRENVDWEI